MRKQGEKMELTEARYATVQSGPCKGEQYVLCFGKNQFLVPAENILSYPKKPNTLPNGAAVGAVLNTKSPDSWTSYCAPDFLIKIRGEEGTCVYTTFHVDGTPESRFLRLIVQGIAEKNFPIVKESTEALLASGALKISNERQQARVNVLSWRKDVDCPDKAQLNPELNHWPALPKDQHVKTCRVGPDPKKRVLKGPGPHTKRRCASSDFHKYVESETYLPVSAPGAYAVNYIEHLGMLRVTTFVRALEEEESASASVARVEEDDDEEDDI